jgi:hypothetical protein
MRFGTKCVPCALILGGTLFMSSKANAQSNTVNGTRADERLLEREGMAESIISREEAGSGRAFDPRFRAQVKNRLASLSLTALESQLQQQGLGPKVLGDSQASLVYTPITPCRIINTLLAGGPIPAGGTRTFSVTASNLSNQGGSALGCGVPFGPATAAVINFVAVNPAGAGDLRQTPFGTPVPLASFLNYVRSGIPSDNTSNGSVVTLCNPATTTCTNDFTIQADASAVQLVADVQGYFSAVTEPELPVYITVGDGPGSTTSNVPLTVGDLQADLTGASQSAGNFTKGRLIARWDGNTLAPLCSGSGVDTAQFVDTTTVSVLASLTNSCVGGKPSSLQASPTFTLPMGVHSYSMQVIAGATDTVSWRTFEIELSK